MLIPANVKVKVINVSFEEREFLSKDGTSKIKRKVLNFTATDPEGGWVKVTSFDPSFAVPKPGDSFQLPPVKKYEFFDGMIQNVMV